MWAEIFDNLADSVVFHPPVNHQKITAVETALNITLPQTLTNLLKEANGIDDEYGFGLVWSIQKIQSENLAFRQNSAFAELYMPFDHLLFFADDANGDLFAFPIQGNQIRRDDIFKWDHETDSRIWLSPTLKHYLKWRVSQ